MSTLLAGVRGDQHPTCIGTRKRGHMIEKEVKARASNDEKPLMRRRLISATLLAYCLLSAPGLWAAEPPPEWNAIGDQTARLLAEYIRIDTQNPPGRTVEAVEFLQRLLREAGLEIEVIAADPEKPILRATLRGTGQRPKPIVLLNHMDVVHGFQSRSRESPRFSWCMDSYAAEGTPRSRRRELSGCSSALRRSQ